MLSVIVRLQLPQYLNELGQMVLVIAEHRPVQGRDKLVVLPIHYRWCRKLQQLLEAFARFVFRCPVYLVKVCFHICAMTTNKQLIVHLYQQLQLMIALASTAV